MYELKCGTTRCVKLLIMCCFSDVRHILVDVSAFTSCVTLPHLESVPLFVYPLYLGTRTGLVQRRRIRDSTVFQNYLYTFDALRIGGHSLKSIMIPYMHLVLCMPVSMCVARTSHRLKFKLLLVVGIGLRRSRYCQWKVDRVSKMAS